MIKFYIADKKKNNAMKDLDLCHNKKVFVESELIKSHLDNEKIYKNYNEFKQKIYKIIEESKKHNDFWVPLIKVNDDIFVDQDIIEISDGEHVIFTKDLKK